MASNCIHCRPSSGADRQLWDGILKPAQTVEATKAAGVVIDQNIRDTSAKLGFKHVSKSFCMCLTFMWCLPYLVYDTLLASSWQTLVTFGKQLGVQMGDGSHSAHFGAKPQFAPAFALRGAQGWCA